MPLKSSHESLKITQLQETGLQTPKLTIFFSPTIRRLKPNKILFIIVFFPHYNRLNGIFAKEVAKQRPPQQLVKHLACYFNGCLL